MYCGIGEQQLAQIDNEQNREIVRLNILKDYQEKYFEDGLDSEVWNKMINILKCELSAKKLHELLVLDGDDADVIIWNRVYDNLKYDVSEFVYGAKRFFKVGGDAQLNEDEYWDEYHIMLGFIPENTREFVAAFCNKDEWKKLTDNVAGYIKAVVPTKCKWVAFCHDGAYEDCSKGSFDNKKDCYNDMRNVALEKMKWNTNYDEDYADADSVSYKVRFTQDMIIHTSYSGTYVYKIVGENEDVKLEDIFTEEFNEWLKKMDFNWY